MTWKIRHEGSPSSIEGLTVPQVVEGLQDGLWEPTDEVMGPQDRQWIAIENHPQFEEIAADIEPPPPRVHEDETRLDMNPLIDVTLVLLIFFILTTSYAALQKVLDMPQSEKQGQDKIVVVPRDKAREILIRVEARQENGKPVIRVEGKPVEAANLVAVLSGYVNETKKNQLLLDATDVDWGTVVAIQDAAKGARIQKVNYLVKPQDLKK